ncbi:MAG: gamma-butyrobetaine hydroxylase [Gammaproteobacteria bacterium]|nr:gamma-butyrobetaine hydroxylase [Gammaproteobacteria bacterium]
MLTHFEFEPDSLTLAWNDGRVTRLDVLWLQDHDPAGRHGNGQRLISVLDLDWQAVIRAVERQGDGLMIHLNTGRQLNYPLATLARDCQMTPEDDRCQSGKTLWCGNDFQLPVVGWQDYLSKGDSRRQALAAVAESGLVLLRGVPCKPGQVLEVIETFGFVRETNYGRLFDVQTVVSPSNLAFSNLGLGPHTDNPYRDPVPGVQLLHCLANEVEGGENLLVDGFQAAVRLQAEHPDAFELLTRVRLPYRFSDEQADLRSRVPFIETDDGGRVIKVRYNNRSIASFMLPFEEQRAFYRAYRLWAEMLSAPELALTVRLEAGDCLVFDNTRVMHARTAFTDGGRRHLQGAYSDLDGLYSTLYQSGAKPC